MGTLYVCWDQRVSIGYPLKNINKEPSQIYVYVYIYIYIYMYRQIPFARKVGPG